MSYKTEKEAFNEIRDVRDLLNNHFDSNDWEIKTWENIGWHSCVFYGSEITGGIKVCWDGISNSYSAYCIPHSPVVGGGINPISAIDDLESNLQKGLINYSLKFSKGLNFIKELKDD